MSTAETRAEAFSRRPIARKAFLVATGALLAFGFCAAPSSGLAQEREASLVRQGNLSLQNETQRAIDRGIAWLEKTQQPEGYWSTADHTAITGLALMAFLGEPGGRYDDLKSPVVQKGYQFLLSHARPDGGIYNRDQLRNYNTAISMMALLASGNAGHHPVILNARQFVIGMQSAAGAESEAVSGGIGYGNTYKHSDMSNTTLALEALFHSRHLIADQARSGARDLNWSAALEFIQRSQNLPSHNDQPWASDDPANKGGFIYFPGHSMAGETNLPSGRVALRSYGSISYAGLLSYIYADLKPGDPRVTAVLDWLRSNFTLEENPGMGAQGLFYYYHTMAKALSLAGLEFIETGDGRRINWREDLARKLMDLQQPDGSWINENGRWWERDPALVTAYALITLEIIHRGLGPR